MANVLEFSLGLATGGFVGPARGALAAIGGLVAGFGSLGEFAGKVFEQFEKGGALAALSKQTGQSVADIYALEKGFKAVHLSADLVGPAIFQMQKSLGGFNEMGEPTKDIFAGLHLSVEQLKQAKATEAIQSITGALGRLNNSEAANASGKIFGRAAARDMLQLARSGTEFGQALKDAAPQAEIFAKNAAAFERIEIAFGRLKNRGQGLFVGLAEGIAPSIGAALAALNKLDLTGLGQRIGHVFAGLGEAVRQSRVGEVLELTMKAAFFSAGQFLKGQLLESVPILRTMQENVHKTFMGLGVVAAAMLPNGASIYGQLVNIEALRKAGAKAPNPFSDQLGDLLKGLATEALARTQGGDLFAPGAGVLTGASGKVFKASGGEGVSALQRIGLAVFSQGQQDYARETARSTRESSGYLKDIAKLMASRSFSIEPKLTNQ